MRTLTLLFFLSQLSAQENYIENIFKSRIGEVPKLGWLDPERGFLTRQSSPDVIIYAPQGMPSNGQNPRALPATELNAIHNSFLACEVSAPETVIAFSTVPFKEPARALYTTKKLLGPSQSGLTQIPLTSQQMTAVNRVLGWPATGALRRDQAIATRQNSYFYSLHKLYSAQTRLLRQEAIILHGRNGQIIALDLHRNIDTEPFCADCENPTYEDTIGLYQPLNVFELPGFPYPLLLLDTGTIEGRALSFTTFTPTGKLTTFREYEYVVNCG